MAKISLSRSFLFLFDVSFFIRSEESRLFAESVIYVSIESSLRVFKTCFRVSPSGDVYIKFLAYSHFTQFPKNSFLKRL